MHRAHNQMVQPKIKVNCTNCGQEGDALDSCGKCQSVNYCSSRCKFMCSTLHELYCEALTDMRERQKQRPDDTNFLIHRATIHFPIEEKRIPEFRLTKISREDKLQKWSTGPHSEYPTWLGKMIQTNYFIELRATIGEDEQQNGSVHYILNGFGETTEDKLISRSVAEGNLRVFAYTVVDGEKTYQDANLADLRQILNYIPKRLSQINITRGSLRSPFFAMQPEQWVTAWIVHGDKDQVARMDAFEPVKIKKSHPIFWTEGLYLQTSWISINIDLPIRCLKLKEEKGKPGNEWAGFAMETPFGININDWDPEKRKAWSAKILKTVLVAREDEKEFTYQHMQAFFRFCKNVHQNAVLPVKLGRDLGTDISRFITRHLNQETFENHFDGMKKKKAIFSEDWRASVSPFRKTKIITLRLKTPGALEPFVDADAN